MEASAVASVAPEVTVAMPARDAARFIACAIESVLAQRDVALELVVVDDASRDDTAAIACAFDDPRLRLVRNDRPKGIAACHNAVWRGSAAPYVAHVDSDDFVLPGALRKLIDALRGDPKAGQAHCYFFDVDANGRMPRDAFADRWRSFHKNRPPGLDYRKVLMTSSVANGLRTYPRRVLEELGGFDERLPYAIDYDMALRVVDRFAIRLVPEFLYGRRIHDSNTTESLSFKPYRLWAMKYLSRWRMVRERRVSFMDGPPVELWPLLVTRWRLRRARLGGWRPHARRLRSMLEWRVLAPLGARPVGEPLGESEEGVPALNLDVDPRRLRPSARPHRADEIPLVLCIAPLFTPEELEHVLRTCRQLKDAGRAFRCEIAGTRDRSRPNEHIALMKMRRRLGLESEVRISPTCSAELLAERLAEADVYVSPGTEQQADTALAAAIAMELPIVAARDADVLAGELGRLLDQGI